MGMFYAIAIVVGGNREIVIDGVIVSIVIVSSDDFMTGWISIWAIGSVRGGARGSIRSSITLYVSDATLTWVDGFIAS